MPGAAGALSAGPWQVVRGCAAHPALPGGIQENSAPLCKSKSRYSEVAFSPLQHWAAHLWWRNEACPDLSVIPGSLSYGFIVIPLPLQNQGALPLSPFSPVAGVVFRACGCIAEMVVLQPLQPPLEAR